MEVSRDMDLNHLAEHMGSEATTEDAAAMRELLVERFDGVDVGEISEREWLTLLEEAVSQ